MRNSLRISFLAICGIALGLGVTAGAAFGAKAGTLQAAAVKVDITPADPSQLTNQWGVTFVGVHDKTFARVLVVNNGLISAVIVAIDTVEVSDATEFIKRLSQETGIPTTNIILTATHDHNAPIVGMVDASGMHPAGPGGAAFLAKLHDDLITAVKQCQTNLQPVRLGIDSGLCYINVNRDLHGQRGPESQYPSDKTVWVLKFESLNGDPIAIIMNYAVHATIIGMKNNLLTGEVTGAAERTVEQHYNDKVVALYISSAAGDQGPIVSADRNNPSDFEPVNVLGRILGEEVVSVANAMDPKTMITQARIWGAEKTLTCPGQKDPGGPSGGPGGPGKPGESNAQGGPGVPGGPSQPNSAAEAEDIGPTSFQIGLLMIDNIALTRVSAEVVTKIYQEVRQQSPFPYTLMFTLANRRIGYIVDDEAYDLGKGEARMAALKKGCGETSVVNGLLDLMRQYEPRP